MIRTGAPHLIAMRAAGHETGVMFNRYDIADNRDKLAALEAAREFAQQQPGETPNLIISIQRQRRPKRVEESAGRVPES